MKCLILCAGYATRLYPLTLDRPKSLLPIAGKPIIEHILERIEKLEDIDEILIVTNNKFFDNFRNWKRKYSSTKPLRIINDKTKNEEDRLGAIGDIDFVVKQEKINDNLLVIAGDNLFDFNLKSLLEFFKEKNDSVIALYDIKDKSKAARKYGIVELDENNKIINLEEKPEFPKTTLVRTGCYIFSKNEVEELEKCIEHHEKPDNLGDFIKWLTKKENIYGFIFDERWFDIGDKEQLKEADIIWSSKK